MSEWFADPDTPATMNMADTNPSSPAPAANQWRWLPAIARAAIPIVGVTWLGWPIAVVAFYFWLELVLLAIDSSILILRDGHAANAFEVVLILAAHFVPLAFFTLVAAQVFTSIHGWSDALAWVREVLDTGGIRIAVALQVVVAIVFAFARSTDEGGSGQHLELLGNRLLVLAVAALVVGAVMALAGIGAPGPGRTLANALAVWTVALVWLFGDASPGRFNRFARLFHGGKRRR